jgi:predicted alpha/beta-fold hydrolase
VRESERAAAWWARGAHLQTAWARIARSRRLVSFDREVLVTPDDDDLILDQAAAPPGAPRVLLLHGLEGSAYSLHTQGLASLVERPVGRLYAFHFMRRLKPKALDVIARFPRETAHLDPAAIRNARSFWEFDRLVTAPLHGFSSAGEYYSRASALVELRTRWYLQFARLRCYHPRP